MSNDHYHHQQRNVTCLGEGNCNTYALTRLYNSKTEKQEIISRGDAPDNAVQEKKRGGQDRNTKDVKSKKTSCQKMGSGENQLNGITDLGNCIQDMKRKERTILGWYIFYVVSSSIKR